jgi:alkyl hydroperoxide reductase subunit AhpF
VFAAGDVTLVSEQALVHIGEGAKAALSAYQYLLSQQPLDASSRLS